MLNKLNKTTLVSLSAATLLAVTATVQADGQRTQSSGNKHFYQRFDQDVTWAAAQSNCQGRGAHLVTITSDAERSFVASLGGYHFWIGGSDAAQEGRFAWVTGESSAYGYWGSDDGNSDSNDFAYTYSSDRWYFANATATSNYICEWSANNYVGIVNSTLLNPSIA